jgi:hypothetical protein
MTSIRQVRDLNPVASFCSFDDNRVLSGVLNHHHSHPHCYQQDAKAHFDHFRHNVPKNPSSERPYVQTWN